CQDLTCPEGYYPQNHECILNISYCFTNENCSDNQICNLTTHSCQDLTCPEGYYPQNHECILNISYCFTNENCSDN
ncbi:MAG: hypothetical protein ACK4YO_03810, partial [Candidatus Altarchaeaceae archaeon]